MWELRIKLVTLDYHQPPSLCTRSAADVYKCFWTAIHRPYILLQSIIFTRYAREQARPHTYTQVCLSHKHVCTWTRLSLLHSLLFLERHSAIYEDAPVVVDGNLITSRMPKDLPDFCKAILDQLSWFFAQLTGVLGHHRAMRKFATSRIWGIKAMISTCVCWRGGGSFTFE